MDLFFEDVRVAPKRRAHFHAFMADAHARIHAWRQARKRGEVEGDDPIAPVAAALARGRLADLLRRVQRARHRRRDDPRAAVPGAVRGRGRRGRDLECGAGRSLQGRAQPRAVPAVSRPAPRADGGRGAQRRGSTTGCRSYGGRRSIIAPTMRRQQAAMDAAFLRLTGAPSAPPRELALLGRTLEVPQAIDGIARFGFDALCRRPLGAADFLALAEEFHTLFVDHIPVLAEGERDAAKRFITLVDALYDARSSSSPPPPPSRTRSIPRAAAPRRSSSRGRPRASSKCARSTTSRRRMAPTRAHPRAISAA